MDKSLFQSSFIKTDVTALKIINHDYLVAGIGNILHSFRIPDTQFIEKFVIFNGQKIHGFVTSRNEEKLIIYGGKQLQLATLSFKNDTIEIVIENIEIKCNDWIITLIWSKNDTNIALLTAHNIVQIWDIATKSLLQVYGCDEKCIIYSGLLCESNTDIIVFSGTVFSQTIIWKTNDESIHHRLIGHKGVIFSISLNVDENIIVTTSDDRTVRIWSISQLYDTKNSENWITCKIEHKNTLIGHTARVMRSIIADKYIVSIGEDSAMCIWDCNGNLFNQRRIHQDGCLWSVDGDAKNNLVITGGGDGGIIAHSIRIEQSNKTKKINFPNEKISAKKISFTYRGNIICLTENGDIMYYDLDTEEWSMKFESEIKYNNLSLSTCKQFIAVSEMKGQIDIFAETCKHEPNLVHCISKKIDKLLSLHWLPGRKFVTCEMNGIIRIWDSRGDTCTTIDEFVLPMCKERWLTAVNVTNALEPTIIVGDRCGNVHLLNKSVHPIQTISKVHGRLGINSIDVVDDKIITTGRDGTIKNFKYITDPEINIQLLYSIKLPFNWVCNFINDKIVCGFRETDFIIWDIEKNQGIFEFDCGGGHRSWDITKKSDTLQFAFIKNKLIQTYDINLQCASRIISEGFHTKEINSIVLLPHSKNNFTIISGGEDTTLRIHNCKSESKFVFNEKFRITKHLSSIRDICLISELNLLFTIGGRAQMCVWKISSTITDVIECQEILNHMLKSDLDRKGNKSWKHVTVDNEAEIRFMSLTYYAKNDITIFAGCSDGILRTYALERKKYSLTPRDKFNFNSRCILKVCLVIIKSNIVILTMYTNGVIAFWDFTSYIDDYESDHSSLQPFYNKKFHKSGINSFDVKYIDDKTILLATGGDDNDLQLNAISFSCNDFENDEIKIVDIIEWHCDEYHCSQITGIKFLNNYVLSTSIDQRITLLKWNYDVKVDCKFIRQYHTSVSDIQGMEILNDSDDILACVYGKGMEIVSIKLPD